ncbi:MAG: molecular chaperone TorD family protein [Nevskia sp.]|nr:molecular chaperone TorD family protein [Nevskia sp.]
MPESDLDRVLNQPVLLGGFADLFAASLEGEDLAEWRDGTLGRLAPLLGEPGCAEPLARAAGVLAGLGEGAEAVSTLNVSHVRLFSGFGGPRGHAAPYESLYRGEGTRLFGEPAAEMAVLLAANGLAVARDCAEAPDHLAVELLALAALLQAGAPGAPGAPDAAGLRARLAGWVPDFAAACAVCDELGFYAAVAAGLEAFLRLGGAAGVSPST